MTTEQKFFLNIVNTSSAAYGRINNIVGDFNKNIGLTAEFYENANWVLGNTVTENYDLASLFNRVDLPNDVRSSNTDLIKQTLQNALVGISNTTSYPEVNVSTHISTSVMEYRFGISSSFLSGQIYSVSASGLSLDSKIKIPFTFNTDGNLFNSHLFDVPLDFSVYGLDNYSTYNGSTLVKFEHGWEYDSNSISLLIPLQYQTVQASNYYLVFYWGNNDSSFISTSYSVGSISYVGTDGFISSIGINTVGLVNKTLTDVSGRKNFWSKTVPYSVGFTSQSFIDSEPWLWAKDRVNGELHDGIGGFQPQPIRYPILNNLLFEDMIGVSTSSNLYLYNDFKTTGIYNERGTNASLYNSQTYSSEFSENIDYNLVIKDYKNNVPLSFIELNKNPKKTNLNFSNGYSVVSINSILPSAFIKPVTDTKIWTYFVQAMILAKNSYIDNNKIIQSYLGLLDNFVADLLFGINYNNVNDYFVGENLTISKKALKSFTQPYGSSDVTPINFSFDSEYAIYNAVDIVPSKEYFVFDKGYIQNVDKFNLPINTAFEVFKPISLVCNGIDPYSQGNSLAFDYTLNLTFGYQSQNKLNKILYLMSSKYLVSKSEYDSRIKNNQSVLGYYYLANPTSTDYNSYSVSSIPEFRNYGYAGLIPDLKDGVIRPIETRKIISEDYYSETWVNAAGESTDGILDNLNAFLNEQNVITSTTTRYRANGFVELQDLSICATQYALNVPQYWNSVFSNPYSLYSNALINRNIAGFTVLSSQINSGIATGSGSPPYTINNIPVGYNCQIQFVNFESFGSGQLPGTYTSWVLPPSEYITNEQPAQIEYKVSSTGIVDPTSVKILNPGGNFYFDFGTFLVDPPLSGIGATHSYAQFVMDNVSYFNASTDASGNIVTMTQAEPPALGYPVGFKFNPKALVGLGYTSNADIGILVDSAPTVDSFLIAETNLLPGDLEGFVSFDNPSNSFETINFTGGTDEYLLYEREIFNSIEPPYSYGGGTINYISLECKLVEVLNASPSGSIRVNIYADIQNTKVLVASSQDIPYTDINREVYTSIDVPINYTFLNTTLTEQAQSYWVSISQTLENCYLSVKGQYFGTPTSNFFIGTSVVNNSIPLIIAGSIGTSEYDLDVSGRIGITSIPNPPIVSQNQSSFIVFLRKNESYSSNNAVSLGFNTIYQGIANSILSSKINVASLSTVFTGVAFTFSNSILSTTIVTNAFISPDSELLKNQLYVARSLSSYDYINIGMATSSQVLIGTQAVRFSFIFNKLFGGLSNEIYAGFNYYDYAQFGLANPNTLRVVEPFNVVDSWWSYKTKNINKPLSIYPRSFFDRSSYLGSSYIEYAYIGYTHDAYVNIGYNSSGIFYQENSILLSAYPRWKTTWMSRTEETIKDFNIYNTIQSSYQDSINYSVGLANTFIGLSTSYKSAIFEGSFIPSGNLSLPVSVSVGLGTSSGIQLFINNNTEPLIDTFSVTSIGNTSVVGILTTEERNASVYFKVYYYTFSTASISMSWNTGAGVTLIDYHSSEEVLPGPISINSGMPIDNIVFFNVNKTEQDSISVNYGYPLGDSFVIRST